MAMIYIYMHNDVYFMSAFVQMIFIYLQYINIFFLSACICHCLKEGKTKWREDCLSLPLSLFLSLSCTLDFFLFLFMLLFLSIFAIYFQVARWYIAGFGRTKTFVLVILF